MYQLFKIVVLVFFVPFLMLGLLWIFAVQFISDQFHPKKPHRRLHPIEHHP
ncbi:MAG: hypothetical protein QOH35_4987 [Acidobacteriaceae bacterium]|nr:hypothetical protein [Acidobacteriaceae bacterium]